MDWEKVHQNTRICWGIVVAGAALLLWTIPAHAQTPTPQPTSTPEVQQTHLAPNDGLHVNTEGAGIMSGELPAPLPAMPGAIRMPDVAFPYIDFSTWPTVSDGRAGLATQINQRLYDTRAVINEQYTRARLTLQTVRETTAGIREFVGNPMTSVSTQSDSRTVTVNSMASEMAQSVEFSISYLRAVSNLGPLGLDLVFIFIGLGWILFVNLAEWVLRAIIWILKALGSAFAFVLRIIDLILSLIRTIRALILI